MDLKSGLLESFGFVEFEPELEPELGPEFEIVESAIVARFGQRTLGKENVVANPDPGDGPDDYGVTEEAGPNAELLDLRLSRSSHRAVVSIRLMQLEE